MFEFYFILPTIKIAKKTETPVGKFIETNIDFSTKFILTEYDKCVIMEVAVLGFGIKLYIVIE